eukprot:scaffold6094_cov24-Tisochrysis_lutea.AAC.2
MSGSVVTICASCQAEQLGMFTATTAGCLEQLGMLCAKQHTLPDPLELRKALITHTKKHHGGLFSQPCSSQ